MSGQPKQGLDWAGWSVRIFEDDERIDELIDAQGWTGFSIYFYLCQKAYATNGYFYRWSYTNAATTARKMGGGIKSETVKQVVSLCLRIGLFDNGLFDREGILTNKDIQERYMIAIEKRSEKGRTIDPKYWLLSSEETKAYIIMPKNSNSLPENAHSLPENPTKLSKGKLSKVNESVVVEIQARDGVFAVTEQQFEQLQQTYDIDVLKSLKRLAKRMEKPEYRKMKKDLVSYIDLWLKGDEDNGRCPKRKASSATYGSAYDLEAYEKIDPFADMEDE